MDQLASSFADLLESTAEKARSLTVDRAHYGLRLVAFGFVAIALIGMAMTLLVRSGFHLLAAFVGVTVAYAIFGGLFVLAGALVWSRRDNGAS
jgi:hypothetical protein